MKRGFKPGPEPRYHVIRSRDIDNLQLQVLFFLKQLWELAGGVSVDHEGYYIQAVYQKSETT